MLDDGSSRHRPLPPPPATPGIARVMGATLPPRLGRRRRPVSPDTWFGIILAAGFVFALGCIALASLT